MAFAFGYPLVQVVRDSFYAGNFAAPIWVGLDNYKGVIDDPEFRQSLVNNLKLLLTVPVMLGLGLAIALILNDRIRGMRQYQAIVFLPYVLPATAIGIAFSFLLQQKRERDPDRRRGKHVRQEDDRLVLTHPMDAIVEHERDREPEREQHRHCD